jgi:hypothetical protein
VDINDLHQVLVLAWDRESSATPGRWMPERPSIGQCAVTALIVQDLFGGKLLRSVINHQSHYYNVDIEPGYTTDLTLDQFDTPIWATEPELRERDYVLSFPPTVDRYQHLKMRVFYLSPPGNTKWHDALLKDRV